MCDHLRAVLSREMNVALEALSVQLRPPLEHQSNRLYDAFADGQRLLVKEFVKPDEQTEAPQREYQALQLLAPLDLAPQPILFRPQADDVLGPLVVYEFMDGEMWDRHRPDAAELAQLADLWLRINDVPVESLWLSRGYDWSFARLDTHFRAAFQRYAEWAQAVFPPAQQPARLCHSLYEQRRPLLMELTEEEPVLCFCRSDPRFANVIRRPDGRLGLVDWEDSGLRDPARDLADLLTHPNQEDLLAPDEWQAFMQPYLAERGQVDPRISARLHLYLAIFPLFWLSLFTQIGIGRYQEGRIADWHINELPANQRLRRYLARGLAWPEEDFSAQLDHVEGVKFFPARSG